MGSESRTRADFLENVVICSVYFPRHRPAKMENTDPRKWKIVLFGRPYRSATPLSSLRKVRAARLFPGETGIPLEPSGVCRAVLFACKGMRREPRTRKKQRSEASLHTPLLLSVWSTSNGASLHTPVVLCVWSTSKIKRKVATRPSYFAYGTP